MPGPQTRAALWLMPRPQTPIYEALKQLILGLKPLFDDAVSFEPHVTLVSGVPVHTIEEAERILDGALAAARSVPDMAIILGSLQYGVQRFRKVTLQVQRVPELLSLAMVCREAYVLQPELEQQIPHYHALSSADHDHHSEKLRLACQKWINEDFQPHLSLVYSGVYTVDEGLRTKIDERLQDTFGQDYNNRGIGWTNSRIALVAIDGDVDNWRIIAHRDI